MAAPSPWRARAKTSKPRLGAIPAPKEASTKIAPRDENPLGPKTVSCGSRRKDQRGKDYAVGVHHPLQAGHATTHRLADTPQSDVNNGYVELHHDKAKAHRGQGERLGSTSGPRTPLFCWRFSFRQGHSFEPLAAF